MMLTKVIILIITVALASINAQENTQTRVAPSLEECYRNPGIFERDNRLPMSINTLIELVRKVEDAMNTPDIRQVAISLVHRFRQDGIVRASGVVAQSDRILPFSPSNFQFPKHRVLLSRLIPGNAMNFPNSTLTVEERCALHFMLSSSIETQVRGDEATRCNQLSQYRVNRVPRSVKSNFLKDIEMMSETELDKMEKLLKKKSARLEMEEGEEIEEEEAPEELAEDAPEADEEDLNLDAAQVDIASNALSQCPVENGAMRTLWGAVSAGPLISGIAAGLEPQMVNTRELLELSRGQYRARQTAQLRVDNRFAATLSGDLAEVALLQGPINSPNDRISVGVSGAWNATAIPRWYFISQRERLEMTDAEIRGGLDGLILARSILEWRSRFSGLRLSQVLDMYYSQRGVLNVDTRACNRRNLFTTAAPIAELREQTIAFSSVLDREMQMSFTLNADAIQEFSTNAADELATYIPASLNDLSCQSSATVLNDDTIWRAATDIFIFVDTNWPFRDIIAVVSHLLENLDVGRFGSNYTVLNAQNGGIIVNNTGQVSDLHIQWNMTVHQTQPGGLHMPTMLRQMRTMGANALDHNRGTGQSGGRSQIALIIAQNAVVSEADTNHAIDQLQILREELPDLRFIYLAGGTPTRFARFVREEARDIFPLRSISNSGADSVQTQVNPVAQRIREEPRRIVNHRCGSRWEQDNSGASQMNQYVEPRGIVFYRLHPNYFHRSASNRRVRIQGSGFSSITVCHSRRIERPRANGTNSDDVTCRQVNTDTVEIDLSDACGSSRISDCDALFVSVEGVQVHDGNNLRCTDVGCRFPDQARYIIHHDNLGCFSGVEKLFSSLSLLVLSLFVLVGRMF